jgi:hypothetical protein
MWLVLIGTDNTKRYGTAAVPQAPAHRRTTSVSQSQLDGLLPGPELPMIRPVGTPNVVEADVFPPLRAHAQDTSSHFLPFIAEDMAFEEEYEEYLHGLGIGEHLVAGIQQVGQDAAGGSAWDRLPEFAADIADGISDSESVVSIGDLGNPDDISSDDRVADENVNNWAVRTGLSCSAQHAEPFPGYESKDDGGAAQVASRSASIKFGRRPSTYHSPQPRRPRCRERKRDRRHDRGRGTWADAKVAGNLRIGRRCRRGGICLRVSSHGFCHEFALMSL